MFAATRTPPKKQAKAKPSAEVEKISAGMSKVRTSIDEWESGRISPGLTQEVPNKVTQSTTASGKAGRDNQSAPKTRRPSIETTESPPTFPNYGGNRVAEARACLTRAKTHLASSRNTRTDIKEAVISALDRLFQLIKEAELERKDKGKELAVEKVVEPLVVQSPPPQPTPNHDELMRTIKEHEKLIKDNSAKMVELNQKLGDQCNRVEGTTYASVVAGVGAGGQMPQHMALHSVVVSSPDIMDTGDMVLDKIKKAVDAKKEGIIIDRVRKARDSKVIIGCRDRKEIEKITKKLKEKAEKLKVEDIKNKDPMIVLYNVLQSNSNEDIVEAIRVQNKHLFENLPEEEQRLEIRFRRKARNLLTSHVVAKVSPQLWRRFVDAGAAQVDIQRVRVADQSPLIQCSRCLGYGHGRKFCPDSVDVCSHCGGQHLRTHCAEWMADTRASCTNCIKAKLAKVEHNAFSAECPIRRKWEALARSAVSYC